MTLRPSTSLEKTLRFVEKLIPKPLYRFGQPIYHHLLATTGAIIYRNPSRKLFVVAVTGTKGKSSTVEIVRHLLAETGHKTASLSTIQFCIDKDCTPNLYKMTVPGRFALQRFLRQAVDAGCTHAVVEMTSEGARQYRHKGVALDALIFTNLSPEHIESHGSMEKYADAKLSIARALSASAKRPRIIVANADDEWGPKFLEIDADIRVPFSLRDAKPYQVDDKNLRFVWRGQLFSVPLPGLFNLKNCLAALTLGEALGLTLSDMKKGLEHIGTIAGRAERVERGQPFDAVVDYAHTPDSLRALYEAFKNKRIIALLGSTGGGRDTWKRAEMGKMADEYAAVSILANEDPYDEDPKQIVEQIARGFSTHTPKIILDRRAAIAAALKEAKEGDAVLISGKGTDPYIMGPHGSKEAWDDAQVVAEELAKLGYTS